MIWHVCGVEAAEELVPLEGLEPPTSGLGNPCSILLSYSGVRFFQRLTISATRPEPAIFPFPFPFMLSLTLEDSFPSASRRSASAVMF